MASGRLRLDNHHSQEGKHGGTSAVGVAVGVLTKLDITAPMPLVLNAPTLANQSQQGFWGGAQGCDESVAGHATNPLPGSGGGGGDQTTIQAQPGQLALMCSGVSLALRFQRVSRPCHFSTCVAMKGIRRFPSNW